jgi:ABC-type lipoprotein release transport system permease subunit
MMRSAKILSMLAWRNLWRNHRRTIVMLSAITIGVWAMIFMTALTRGMVNDMVRDGLRALPGHVQVHHPEFRNDPSIMNLIPIADSFRRRASTAGPAASKCRPLFPVSESHEASR